MLRLLRSRLLSAVSADSHLPAAASIRRNLLLPFSTAAVPLAPFVAEDYLVTACGLTPAQALKSSKHLAHVKSPSKADAVLAFLADAGLAKADVAAAIVRYPHLLCCRVDKTLGPRIGMLRDIGLSTAQISSLIRIVPEIVRQPRMFRRLEFYLSLLGSFEKVHTALKSSIYFLGQDVERVVKPNLSFLKQCGLTDCDIVKFFSLAPRMVLLEPERVKEIVACVDRLGVPRNSGMFKFALKSVHSIRPERMNAKWDFLKKALGFSEDELSIAVRKFPNVLNFTEDRISRLVEFLNMEVGVKAEYIVRRPALLSYSMERRLIPRHYVIKVLKEKGLLEKDMDFFYVVCLSEKRFAKRFLDPYKEGVPGLAAAYGEQVAP